MSREGVSGEVHDGCLGLFSHTDEQGVMGFEPGTLPHGASRRVVAEGDVYMLACGAAEAHRGWWFDSWVPKKLTCSEQLHSFQTRLKTPGLKHESRTCSSKATRSC